MLEFLFGSLSSMWSVLMLLSAALIFFGAYRLVTMGRPVSALAAYLVLLPLPAIISLCGWMKGSISSLTVIASAPETVLTRGGLAASLTSLLVAVVLTAPTYFVLVYGLLARTRTPPRSPSENIVPAAALPPVPFEPKPGTIRPATSA
jgi:hypothetical protein